MFKRLLLVTVCVMGMGVSVVAQAQLAAPQMSSQAPKGAHEYVIAGTPDSDCVVRQVGATTDTGEFKLHSDHDGMVTFGTQTDLTAGTHALYCGKKVYPITAKHRGAIHPGPVKGWHKRPSFSKDPGWTNLQLIANDLPPRGQGDKYQEWLTDISMTNVFVPDAVEESPTNMSLDTPTFGTWGLNNWSGISTEPFWNNYPNGGNWIEVEANWGNVNPLTSQTTIPSGSCVGSQIAALAQWVGLDTVFQDGTVGLIQAGTIYGIYYTSLRQQYYTSWAVYQLIPDQSGSVRVNLPTGTSYYYYAVVASIDSGTGTYSPTGDSIYYNLRAYNVYTGQWYSTWGIKKTTHPGKWTTINADFVTEKPDIHQGCYPHGVNYGLPNFGGYTMQGTKVCDPNWRLNSATINDIGWDLYDPSWTDVLVFVDTVTSYTHVDFYWRSFW